MFTIKHIDASGIEQIFAAKVVTLEPEGYANGSAPGACSAACVRADDAYFQTGDIYVMNENGKTVAVYRLDALNNPKAGALPAKARVIG